jgi:hypothetical protein
MKNQANPKKKKNHTQPDDRAPDARLAGRKGHENNQLVCEVLVDRGRQRCRDQLGRSAACTNREEGERGSVLESQKIRGGIAQNPNSSNRVTNEPMSSERAPFSATPQPPIRSPVVVSATRTIPPPVPTASASEYCVGWLSFEFEFSFF